MVGVQGLAEAAGAIFDHRRRRKVRPVPPERQEAGDELVGDLVAQSGQIHKSSLGGGVEEGRLQEAEGYGCKR